MPPRSSASVEHRVTGRLRITGRHATEEFRHLHVLGQAVAAEHEDIAGSDGAGDDLEFEIRRDADARG